MHFVGPTQHRTHPGDICRLRVSARAGLPGAEAHRLFFRLSQVRRKEAGISDHLTPEEFFEFIDQGGGSRPVGWHLTDCPECLQELDFLLLAEVPATAEEEAMLDRIPEVTVEDLLERLRPRIGSSG